MKKDLMTKLFSHVIFGKISKEYLLWTNRKILLGTLKSIKHLLGPSILSTGLKTDHKLAIIHLFHISYKNYQKSWFWEMNCLKNFQNCIPNQTFLFKNHLQNDSAVYFLKFIYSEKATKFCEIFILILSCVVPVKSKAKISQNFVAFSEYNNFNENETIK